MESRKKEALTFKTYQGPDKKWRARFFDKSGNKKEIYIGFEGYTEEDLIGKIIGFFPMAKMAEAKVGDLFTKSASRWDPNWAYALINNEHMRWPSKDGYILHHDSETWNGKKWVKDKIGKNHSKVTNRSNTLDLTQVPKEMRESSPTWRNKFKKMIENESPSKSSKPKWDGKGPLKMTMDQWKNIHKDYKRADGNHRYTNTMDPKTGSTVSVEVEIIRENYIKEKKDVKESARSLNESTEYRFTKPVSPSKFINGLRKSGLKLIKKGGETAVTDGNDLLWVDLKGSDVGMTRYGVGDVEDIISQLEGHFRIDIIDEHDPDFMDDDDYPDNPDIEESGSWRKRFNKIIEADMDKLTGPVRFRTKFLYVEIGGKFRFPNTDEEMTKVGHYKWKEPDGMVRSIKSNESRNFAVDIYVVKK